MTEPEYCEKCGERLAGDTTIGYRMRFCVNRKCEDGKVNKVVWKGK